MTSQIETTLKTTSVQRKILRNDGPPSLIFWSNSSKVGSMSSHPSGGGFLLRRTFGIFTERHRKTSREGKLVLSPPVTSILPLPLTGQSCRAGSKGDDKSRITSGTLEYESDRAVPLPLRFLISSFVPAAWVDFPNTGTKLLFLALPWINWMQIN